MKTNKYRIWSAWLAETAVRIGSLSLATTRHRAKGQRAGCGFLGRLIVCGSLAVVIVSGSARAADVNYTWDFTNRTQYYMPDEGSFIEIDQTPPGYAQLMLQPQQFHFSTYWDYVAGGVSNQNLFLGPEVSLLLKKMDVSRYFSSGSFVSRIFDGGVGNSWKSINSKVTRASIITDPDLVAVYRMDNDGWLDAVSGVSGTAMNDPAFSIDAKRGTYAGYFGGATDYLQLTGRPLNDRDACTIAVWVKLDRWDNDSGIVLARANASQLFGLHLYNTPNVFIFRMLTTSGLQTAASGVIQVGRWYFVVCTWDNVTQIPRIYVDGVLAGQGSAVGGRSLQGVAFNVPLDSLFMSRKARATIDEVYMYKRSLSQSEISALYVAGVSAARFRVRSGVTPIEVVGKEFVGIDGTTNSYFPDGNWALASAVGGSFSPTNRYAQYKVELFSNTNNLITPELQAAGLFGNGQSGIDAVLGDYAQGTFDANITNTPTGTDRGYVGVRKQTVGGYYTNGVFTSRSVDAGASVSWDQISWVVAGEELPTTILGLIGLYHGNNWADSSGAGHSGNSAGSTYSDYAKLGAKAALFDGATHYVDGFGFSTFNTVEFWLNNSNPNDGLLTLNASEAICISNRIVCATGFTNNLPQIYINGKAASPRLLAGWNHVALVWDVAVSAGSFTVGRANGDYMAGMIDEMAVFDRQLSSGEIVNHYVKGRKEVGGLLKFQARASNDPLFTGVPFVGPGGSPTAYHFSPGGLACGPGRYFQYRVFLDGDGTASPGVSSVTVGYDGNTKSEVDDTATEIHLGTFESARSCWYGDDMSLKSIAAFGPFPINVADYGTLAGLWHMDEASWGTVFDEVRGGHGTAENGAAPSPSAKIGPYCGLFDGVDDKVTLANASMGPTPFSVGLWMRSAALTRSSLISSFSGASNPYFALELNSDGAGALAAGRVAFVLSNGGTSRSTASTRRDLNDGRWHHVLGIRNDNQMMLYLDGDLAGITEIGSAFGDINGANAVLATHGNSGTLYYKGLIDEVVMFSHALTRSELGEISGAGFRTRNTGIHQGLTLDASQPAIWSMMAWSAYGTHGLAVPDASLGLAGLWHLDETSGPAVDSSGNGNNGAVTGTQGAAGRFSRCVQLNGSTGSVDIPDSASLEPSALTVEAWVNLNKAVNVSVFDKRNANNGYALGTDPAGNAVLWLGNGGAGVSVTSPLPVRSGQWNHLAATFDGVNARLFVNGQMTAVASPVGINLAAGAAMIGANYLGGNRLDGLVDEVAVFGRVLSSAEIADHYAAGVVTLKLQARTWDPLPQGGFVGPGGSSNTYFTLFSGDNLIGDVPLGRYMEYKAYLSTEDHRIPPVFLGVNVDVSSYPNQNPTVQPVEGMAYPFPGRLRAFGDTVWNDPGDVGGTARIEYQISGDSGANPNWYYWDTFGATNQWKIYSGATPYPLYTSTKDEINANIRSFYDTLPAYFQQGGVFRFRAFLHSEGDYQIKADKVTLTATDGRIVVTQPNTTEIGDNAFIAGCTNMILWTSAGNVSGNLRLLYSYDSGTNWTQIATGVPNTGSYPWLTPWDPADREHLHCRIRIEDVGDATGSIWDESDSDFEIVDRFRVFKPNGGEVWYSGETNTIVWASTPAKGGTAWIMFNGRNQTAWADFVAGTLIAATTNNLPGVTNNTYTWVIPKTNAAILSEQARVGVSLEAYDKGFDCSDSPFTLAGARIIQPAAGVPLNRGNTENIVWVSAGAGADVALDFSSDGGTNWVTISNSLANVTGTNIFPWYIDKLLTDPTSKAMLRIRGKGAYSRAWGTSDIFTIADVDIKRPAPGEKWQVHSTNTIEWTAGGAGSEVDVFYASDGGTNWNLIATRYPNVDFPVTNRLTWVVPSDPSAIARIKIQGVDNGPGNNFTSLWSQTDYFRIAGVRVNAPNGGGSEPDWLLNRSENIRWSYAEAGLSGAGDLFISYEGDTNYTLIKSAQNFETKILPYTPITPTVKGRVRIVATSPDVTNMWDISDYDFTVVGLKMLMPTNSAVYTLGQNIDDAIRWLSAGTKKTSANVYYSIPGQSLVTVIPGTANSDDAPVHENRRAWSPLFQDMVNPSEQAKLLVVTDGGSYTGYSETFTARGVKLTRPTLGTWIDIGTPQNLYWIEAGIDVGARANFYLSLNGGSTWQPTAIIGAPTYVGDSTVQVWNVNGTLDPTTNAMVRMSIFDSPTPADTNYVAYSKLFTLRGLKMTSPIASDNWELGSSQTISFLSAAAGPRATIYYSSSGGLGYDATPVAEDINIQDGLNTNLWTIDFGRVPSTSAVLKVVSDAGGAQLTAVSPTFTLGGVMVTRPLSYDIWAVGETNTIRWLAVGTSGNKTIEVMTNGVVVQTIPGLTGASYDWPVPMAAVGTNVTIRVRDEGPLGYSGVSQPFQVVSSPMVRIIAPAPGEFWRVSETYRVEWTKGGGMPFDFDVRYSADGFTNSVLLTQAQHYEPAENKYWLEWTIGKDDGLGAFQVAVSNRSVAGVSDVSAPFYLSPKFTIIEPNGGETYYALKNTFVQWYTEGDVQFVDMYYSTNATRATNSWVKVNTAGPIDCRGDKTTSQYEWKVPDVQSSTMWLRVQDTHYTGMFDRSLRGPFDDSNNSFTSRYYEITWRVYHVDESGVTNELNHLSVADSSGWSASDLDSGVKAYYPYGRFDSLWYREFFHDQVVFDWLSEPSRTQEVQMVKSEIEPDYHVLANFTFNSAFTNFAIQAWLERSGSILGTPENCSVVIYDSVGTQIGMLASTAPRDGIFWLTWAVPPASYNANEVFFGKVMIRYSGVTYSSGTTFMMRQSAGTLDIPPDYSVKANFTYNTAQTNFSIQSWLEEGGKVVEAASNSWVWVYNNSGVGLTNFSVALPLNGVFWHTWDVTGLGYSSADVFFGKVTAMYEGRTYSAGFTFQMRQTASEDIETVIDFIQDSSSNILSEVSGVGSLISQLSTDTLAGMSNITGAIDMTRTNLLMSLGTNQLMLADVLAGLGLANTNISVILPSLTNMNFTLANVSNMLDLVQADNMSDLARILTRPTTLDYGSTNVILYKTRPGYGGAVQLSVSPGGVVLPMTEVVGGIYQRTDLIANWGIGSYTITCTDPQARDSIIVKVIAKGMDQLPAVLATVSNNVAKVDHDLATVSALVQTLQGAGDLSGLMSAINDVQQSVEGIDISSTVDLSALNRIEQQLGGSASSQDTLLSRMESIADRVTAVLASAADATKKAQTAKTEAANAASLIQQLKSEVARGNVTAVKSMLQDLEDAVANAQKSIDEIPKGISMQQYYKSITDISETISKMAASKGFKDWIKAGEVPEGELSNGADKTAIGALSRSMEEVKGEMRLMQKLMDEMIYEPVVEETLLGTE